MRKCVLFQRERRHHRRFQLVSGRRYGVPFPPDAAPHRLRPVDGASRDRHVSADSRACSVGAHCAGRLRHGDVRRGSAAALRRDYDRLTVAWNESDSLPLGSGAVAGTSYAIDVNALARRLGFSRVVENSLDATADRDFVSSTLHAYALVMVHLSRLAEDLIIFTGEEFGFFDLADSVSTGSSLMPQKKNPDPLELVRGKTGRVIGHVAGWLTTMKGLPSGYNKDLQEDKEAVFDAERTVLKSLQAVNAVVASLETNGEASEAATTGLLLATDVADYLVGRGLPFRRAHEVVGRMVRELMVSGRDFSSLTPDEWKSHHELFEDDVVERVTPRGSVDARATPQSTNPKAVRAALARVREWVSKCR